LSWCILLKFASRSWRTLSAGTGLPFESKTIGWIIPRLSKENISKNRTLITNAFYFIARSIVLASCSASTIFRSSVQSFIGSSCRFWFARPVTGSILKKFFNWKSIPKNLFTHIDHEFFYNFLYRIHQNHLNIVLY
jgi:hypothetical protein